MTDWETKNAGSDSRYQHSVFGLPNNGSIYTPPHPIQSLYACSGDPARHIIPRSTCPLIWS